MTGQSKVQEQKKIKKLLDLTDTMTAAVSITTHLSFYSMPLCTEIKCSLNLFLLCTSVKLLIADRKWLKAPLWTPCN